MSRLGLTNIYLKCGLLLILFGLACGAIFFSGRHDGGSDSELLLWSAFGGFTSGVVLYLIGRIKHAMRHFVRREGRS